MKVELQPFYQTEDLLLDVNYSIENNILRMDYILRGALIEEIELSKEVSTPKRTDDLWKDSCFELFLFHKSGAYWEINLSPSKNWNIYKFRSYRDGMQRENKINRINIKTDKQENQFLLTTKINFNKILDFEDVNLAFTAVTKDKSGEINYWALKHLEKPDFHKFI